MKMKEFDSFCELIKEICPKERLDELNRYFIEGNIHEYAKTMLELNNDLPTDLKIEGMKMVGYENGTAYEWFQQNDAKYLVAIEKESRYNSKKDELLKDLQIKIDNLDCVTSKYDEIYKSLVESALEAYDSLEKSLNNDDELKVNLGYCRSTLECELEKTEKTIMDNNNHAEISIIKMGFDEFNSKLEPFLCKKKLDIYEFQNFKNLMASIKEMKPKIEKFVNIDKSLNINLMLIEMLDHIIIMFTTEPGKMEIKYNISQEENRKIKEKYRVI